MELSQIQVQKLLEYPGNIQISQLGLSMALTRLRNLYKNDPNLDTLTKCTTELNIFFKKFSAIMQKDYNWIINL